MSDFNPNKLAGYLKSVRDIPFKWGEHDCLIFTNRAFQELYGEGWADDWLGRYMRDGFPLKRKDLQVEFGYRTFTEAVDKRLHRIQGVPPRGSLVTTKKARRWVIGNAMGISVGIKAAFVSKHGLVYHPIETIDKAWVKI